MSESILLHPPITKPFTLTLENSTSSPQQVSLFKGEMPDGVVLHGEYDGGSYSDLMQDVCYNPVGIESISVESNMPFESDEVFYLHVFMKDLHGRSQGDSIAFKNNNSEPCVKLQTESDDFLLPLRHLSELSLRMKPRETLRLTFNPSKDGISAEMGRSLNPYIFILINNTPILQKVALLKGVSLPQGVTVNYGLAGIEYKDFCDALRYSPVTIGRVRVDRDIPFSYEEVYRIMHDIDGDAETLVKLSVKSGQKYFNAVEEECEIRLSSKSSLSLEIRPNSWIRLSLFSDSNTLN